VKLATPSRVALPQPTGRLTPRHHQKSHGTSKSTSDRSLRTKKSTILHQREPKASHRNRQQGTTHRQRRTKAIRRIKSSAILPNRRTIASHRESQKKARHITSDKRKRSVVNKNTCRRPHTAVTSPSVHTPARTIHESTPRPILPKRTIEIDHQEQSTRSKTRVDSDKRTYSFARARIPRSNSTRGCISFVSGSAIMLADPSCAIITRPSRILSAHHNTLTP